MKSILLAFFIITTSVYAAEITKDQASVMEAAVGSSIGTVAGDLLQHYTRYTYHSVASGITKETQVLQINHVKE